MAKLVIKPKDPKHEGIMAPQHLDITLDGVRITKLKELILHLETGCVAECAIAFYPDSIDIDASLLASLAAHVKLTKAGENDGDGATQQTDTGSDEEDHRPN